MTRREATGGKATKASGSHGARAVKKDAVLTVSGKPIEIADTFKHLGRVTMEADSDEAVALRNLERARRKWVSMRVVLTRDGAEPKMMVVFCRVVALHTLLCGSESWVPTQDLMQQLRIFHQRRCRGLESDFIRQKEVAGEWICPNSDKALQKAGCQSIEERTQRRRDAIMEPAKTKGVRVKSARTRK